MSSTSSEDHLRKCAHGPCICMVYPEQEYCSRHCSRAANTEKTEEKCDCGHLNCAMKGTSQSKPQLSFPASRPAAL